MEGLICKAITPHIDAEISVSKREVTSYKSTWGAVDNYDRVREFTRPGTFASWDGLQPAIRKGQIASRHNHKDLVAVMIHGEEDREGLLTTEKYATDPLSDRIFGMVRDRIINTSSFQASYKASDRIKHKGADGQPVWELSRLILKEAGPADPDFAVNPETRVVAVKGLQEVASVLSNLSGLESQEVWTLESLKGLSPEDKDALIQVLSQMPKGMACEAILGELMGEQASDEPDYDAAIGKAFQLTELYRAMRVDGLLDRISTSLTKCRPSAATN